VGNNGNVSDILHVKKLTGVFEMVGKGTANINTIYERPRTGDKRQITNDKLEESLALVFKMELNSPEILICTFHSSFINPDSSMKSKIVIPVHSEISQIPFGII
jgi:hypothetical protein